MDEARSRADWNHTAQICTAIAANNPFGSGKKEIDPRDYHPFYRQEKQAGPAAMKRAKVPITAFKVFLAPPGR